MLNTLHLRIVDKNDLETGTRIISQDNLEKHKSKRGRPRKASTQFDPEIDLDSTPEVVVVVPTISNTIILPKKRGRKKKYDMTGGENTIKTSESSIPRSYIVQLQVTSADLEKIQQQFVSKSQKLWYEQGMNGSSENDSTTANSTTANSTTANSTVSSYYSILNDLELTSNSCSNPMANPNLSSFQQLVPSSQQLFEVPNLYQTIVIPISPDKVPIKLFEENHPLKPNKNDGYGEIYRDTNCLMLPLLDNHNTWPDKSPYACWNCDFHFSGTPWGIPDIHKEPNENKFYGYGNFCSPECTARYLVDRESSNEFWEKYSILCLIYQMVYNLDPETKVTVAPPREALAKYGGKLSYDNYHNAKHDQMVEIYKLPMIPVRLHIGELSRSLNIDNLLQQTGQKNPCLSQKQRRCVPIDPVKITQAEENIRHRTHDLLKNKNSVQNFFKFKFTS